MAIEIKDYEVPGCVQLRDRDTELLIEPGQFGMFSVNFPYDAEDSLSYFIDLKEAARKAGKHKNEPIYGWSQMTADDIGEEWIGLHKDDHPESKLMRYFMETEPELFEADKDYEDKDED